MTRVIEQATFSSHVQLNVVPSYTQQEVVSIAHYGAVVSGFAFDNVTRYFGISCKLISPSPPIGWSKIFNSHYLCIICKFVFNGIAMARPYFLQFRAIPQKYIRETDVGHPSDRKGIQTRVYVFHVCRWSTHLS